MGIIESWKGKIRAVRSHRMFKGDIPTNIEVSEDIGGLILEFESLCLKRKILEDDQAELIRRLDDGKITAFVFREEMAQNAQEAILVASKIELAKMQLADLGYRDIWV